MYSGFGEMAQNIREFFLEKLQLSLRFGNKNDGEQHTAVFCKHIAINVITCAYLRYVLDMPPKII